MIEAKKAHFLPWQLSLCVNKTFRDIWKKWLWEFQEMYCDSSWVIRWLESRHHWVISNKNL